MPRRTDLFATVRTEGGLLPSDVLARIANNDPGLAGLKPLDYHLNANERIGEMINRSWNRAMGAWAAFNEALARLAPEDTATTVTRERWLLVLFDELGFGRLQPVRATEVDGRQFPVSHEWSGHVPLHLVGARIDLDRRTAGVAGAARSSPHSLVQELLNASPDRLWGIVSNGRQLRLLRDNAALTRQSFVEFDLAAMMAGQVYPDFVLLWLLLHESRFEGEQPANSWIEKWAKEAEAQGTRALDQLRIAVETGIASLGQGFLSHPHNGRLREALWNGQLDKQDFYRQLLRLVYRLLFLFVAEDRDLLYDPDASAQARERYVRFYSLDRLRRLAERRRGTLHSDLYESLTVVTHALDEDGSDALGLPALGSYLWSPGAVTDLDGAKISNRDFLASIYALAFHVANGVRSATDYRNLGAEELGSVYESLLELHPDLNVDAGTFVLSTAAGHERKSTGSYYTPTSLIVSLLDTALEPVLDAAAMSSDPESAILGLRVVDPACGSGHFLIAAAHRIAKRLATIRTGDDEPAPGALRRSLRDVIGHCIYGVDMNPMAVELCRVSLWMEALEPGKPLSFLDHHILLGNSLLGTTPELMTNGIPDEAFRPIVGDDSKVASSLRIRNAAERGGQHELSLEWADTSLIGELGAGIASIDTMPEESVEDVKAKERSYRTLRDSSQSSCAQMAADSWLTAFMVEKRSDFPAITHSVVVQAVHLPAQLSPEVATVVRDNVVRYHFHHWPIAFPSVFDRQDSGFDVVIGNPPWGQVEFKEAEWFSTRNLEIAGAEGDHRKKLIDRLQQDDPGLWKEYQGALRETEAVGSFLRHSGRFPLSGTGRINTYAVFAELMRSILSSHGRMGAIVPPGIATEDTTKEFFADIVRKSQLVSLFAFENKRLLFPAVHAQQQFCLLTLSASNVEQPAQICFYAHDVADIADPSRRFSLTAAEILALNPNTGTLPVIRTSTDSRLLAKLYGQWPILIRNGGPNPWALVMRQGLFNMSTASSSFHEESELDSSGWRLTGNRFRLGNDEMWPVYESKMFHLFDTRWLTHVRGEERKVTPAEKGNYDLFALPRYWMRKSEVVERLRDWDRPWLPVMRAITNPMNERTAIPALIPLSSVGHSALVLFVGREHRHLSPYLVASLSSFVLDFVTRLKLGGRNLGLYIAEQLPVLPPEVYAATYPWTDQRPLVEWMAPRLAELFGASADIADVLKELPTDYRPSSWNEDARWRASTELDAAFMLLYGLTYEEADYVMDRFPVLAAREAAQGGFRTKEAVLGTMARFLGIHPSGGRLAGVRT